MKALALLVLLLAPCAHGAPSAAEAEKMEALIPSVEQLGDEKFLRNGTQYGNRVASAEDFIRVVASRSSVSGKPYEIVFADGRRSTSEAFRARLKEL